MVSAQRVLFLLGFVALGAGIVLICFASISVPSKTTEFHEIVRGLMFLIYGLPCIVGGLILIFLFKRGK